MSDSINKFLSVANVNEAFLQFAEVSKIRQAHNGCHLPPDHAYWDELRAWIPEDHVIDKEDVRALDNVRLTYISCVKELDAGFWTEFEERSCEDMTLEGIRAFLDQTSSDPDWDGHFGTDYDDNLSANFSRKHPYSDDELAIKRSFVNRFSGPPPEPPPTVIRWHRPDPFAGYAALLEGVTPRPLELEREDIEIKGVPE